MKNPFAWIDFTHTFILVDYRYYGEPETWKELLAWIDQLPKGAARIEGSVAMFTNEEDAMMFKMRWG